MSVYSPSRLIFRELSVTASYKGNLLQILISWGLTVLAVMLLCATLTLKMRQIDSSEAAELDIDVIVQKFLEDMVALMKAGFDNIEYPDGVIVTGLLLNNFEIELKKILNSTLKSLRHDLIRKIAVLFSYDLDVEVGPPIRYFHRNPDEPKTDQKKFTDMIMLLNALAEAEEKVMVSNLKVESFLAVPRAEFQAVLLEQIDREDN